MRRGFNQLPRRTNIALALDDDRPDRNIQTVSVLGPALQKHFLVTKVKAAEYEDVPYHRLDIGLSSPRIARS